MSAVLAASNKGKAVKTRIIVAAVGIVILLAAIFLLPIWAMGVVMGAIAGCAAFELYGATVPESRVKSLKSPFFRIRCYVTAAGALIPFLSSVSNPWISALCVAFFVYTLSFGEVMLSFRGGEPIHFSAATSALFAGAVMPFMQASVVRLGLNENGWAFIIMVFVATFCCDSGAYFAGMFLGKHKLAPHLSPNKTIEGSIGGLLSGVVFLIAYGLILLACGFKVNFLVIAIYGFLVSVACELGDLCFSAIKRIAGVKDYGNILPGHGGAMDRFDSMTWTAPLMELLTIWVCAISK